MDWTVAAATNDVITQAVVHLTTALFQLRSSSSATSPNPLFGNSTWNLSSGSMTSPDVDRSLTTQFGGTGSGNAFDSASSSSSLLFLLSTDPARRGVTTSAAAIWNHAVNGSSGGGSTGGGGTTFPSTARGTTGQPKPWPVLKQPLYAVVLLSAAYLAVAVVGVVSNGLVIAVIYRSTRMRTVTNYFLANLATADILVCLFVLPITLLQNVYTEWWYGALVCKIAPYLQGVAVSASVNTLAAVAVERYFAIFHPHSSKMTAQTAAVMIAVIWLVPAGLFVPWVLVYREKLYHITGFEYVACHADWPSLDLDRAFTLGVVFLTCYLIPLTFIAVFYLLIGVKVFRRRVRGLRQGSRAALSLSRTKCRILRMLIVVFVVFTLSWLPLYCVGIRLLFAGQDSMSATERIVLKRYLFPVAQWLGASNSCVNPFVYCYFSHGFRRGIHQAARCRRASM